MLKLSQEAFIEQAGQWITRAACEHETLMIKSSEGAAVMISEEDWKAMNAILQVVSMSGMAHSLRSAPAEGDFGPDSE